MRCKLGGGGETHRRTPLSLHTWKWTGRGRMHAGPADWATTSHFLRLSQAQSSPWGSPKIAPPNPHRPAFPSPALHPSLGADTELSLRGGPCPASPTPVPARTSSSGSPKTSRALAAIATRTVSPQAGRDRPRPECGNRATPGQEAGAGPRTQDPARAGVGGREEDGGGAPQRAAPQYQFRPLGAPPRSAQGKAPMQAFVPGAGTRSRTRARRERGARARRRAWLGRGAHA